MKIKEIQETIQKIKKSNAKFGDKEDTVVKQLVKKFRMIRKSLMIEEKFLGRANQTEDHQFGRKTLKTAFEDHMNLPYERFSLYQK